MRDRERKTERTEMAGGNGNLYRAYGESLGWGGCADEDCLPKCRPSKGHCERLGLFLERGRPQ